MLQFILRRLLLTIPTFFVTSVVAFAVIQLPPGDFATTYVAGQAAQGDNVNAQETLAQLRASYGLDQPVYIQYFKWIWGIITRGDYGIAFEFHQPVSSLIWDRVLLTLYLSLGSVLITWLIAFPIGIYSAVKQYSLGDYFFTFLGFIGISIPSFLVALVLMYILFNISTPPWGGCFPPKWKARPGAWQKRRTCWATSGCRC